MGFWLAFNAAPLGRGRLDREPLGALWALPLRQFLHGQLRYLVIIGSTICALVGAHAAWKHIPRTGDIEVLGKRATEPAG